MTGKHLNVVTAGNTEQVQRLQRIPVQMGVSTDSPTSNLWGGEKLSHLYHQSFQINLKCKSLP